MTNLTAFALFLQEYGAYAMATVFMLLYTVERRERRETQEKYEDFLRNVPKQYQEFSTAQADAVETLERAFVRAGIELGTHSFEDKNNKMGENSDD